MQPGKRENTKNISDIKKERDQQNLQAGSKSGRPRLLTQTGGAPKPRTAAAQIAAGELKVFGAGTDAGARSEQFGQEESGASSSQDATRVDIEKGEKARKSQLLDQYQISRKRNNYANR